MSARVRREPTSGSAGWTSRTDELERRLEAFEQDRKYAEWRIHTNMEQMLDGLLGEVRAIADLLTRTR